jgi:hypothetical protein
MLTRLGADRSNGFACATAPDAADLTRFANYRFPIQTRDVCLWLAGLVQVFWRVQPRTTALVIVATVFAHFTSLAAFLLPLKVLLLAGSGGTQEYFGVMIDPDVKKRWMIGLSFAAVSLYFLTRFLRAYTAKMSGEGSDEVMKRANQLELLGNQGAVGRRYFSKITRLCADLITAAMAFSAIALIDATLVSCLVILFTVQYSLSALLLDSGRPLSQQLATRMRENPDDYIDNLYSICFWSAFLILLFQFFAGDNGNILLAVLSFILVRLGLKHFASSVNSAVSLAANKGLIDALMFPTHQWQPRERPVRRDFHSLFKNEAHLAKLETALVGHLDLSRPISVRWKDSPVSGFSTFVFNAGPNGPLYLEQVYAPHQAHLIKNEDVLFSHIPRDLLNAPPIRHQFMHGPFQCRLCEYGEGVPESGESWNIRLTELLEQVWSIRPPDHLLQLFRASHAFFYQRLTPQLVDKLWLAVEDNEQAESVRAFHAALPTIHETLAPMPLYVSNRDMTRPNTAVRADGGVFIMSWGRWTLQPMGADLPPNPKPEKLAEMVGRVRQRRPDIPETLGPDGLLLVAACKQLEALIKQENYEAALRALPAILENSTLREGFKEARTMLVPATTVVEVARATELQPSYALSLAG